jgi:hypothetical protein
MAYYDDWGYSINWVYDGVLTDLVKEVGTSKTIIPAYNYYWTQSQFQQIYKNVASKFPQIRGGSFFKYGKNRFSIDYKHCFFSCFCSVSVYG